jgi:hypothetical protein
MAMWPIFRGLLHKSVQHRSLTLPFEPYRFWIRICRDIHNWKMTLQLGESGSRRLAESGSRRLTKSGSRRLSDLLSRGVADSLTRWIRESLTLRHGESENRLLNVKINPPPPLGESLTWLVIESATPKICRVGELLWCYSNFFNLSSIYRTFNG